MRVTDICIIGGGPAGLTAALYALRANKTVRIIEKATFGGQITYSPKVENYPGFLSASGNEIAEKMVDQVLAQGGEIELEEVIAVQNGETKVLKCRSGEYFGCKALIIATGARHRLLSLPREEEFIGNGISFCAVCDGAFFKDRHVAVIGGGNSALQEALLLSETASKVTIIQNMAYLTGEKRLQARVKENEKIEVVLGAEVTELIGDSELKAIKIRKPRTGVEKEIEVDGMFVAIGLVPQNEPFSNVVDLTEYGYVDSFEDCRTSTLGVFVAGDCRKKSVRQVATAIGDGAVAALAACDYIDSHPDF